MKAFEKKWKKNGGGTYGKVKVAAYWREALEWLYEQLDYSTEHKEIKDIIRDELEE